tara:strand:+ start:313 stop:801 length:489 start_codon:yes stop_codon:yes gene_type:complete
MKVKITHTVDLDSVAGRTQELLEPAVDEVRRSLLSFEAICNLLSGDEEELDLAVQYLDLSRRRLAQADTVLAECQSMLTGVNEYYIEQASKKALEEELIKQEEEAKRQEVEQAQREALLAQQQKEQQAEAEALAAKPPPLPPRRWDPVTKTSSPIENEQGGE